MRRYIAVGSIAAVLAILGVLMWTVSSRSSPEAAVDTELYGEQGQVLADDPPVVGFAPEPVPDDFDTSGLGQQAALEPLSEPVAATAHIAAQAHGSTFLLGTHGGVAMHLWRLDTAGWWDRVVGRSPVQDGICFDAGAYGFCTSADQLKIFETTRVWGRDAQDPGPGRRIGIWAPVPDGTALVGLEIDGQPWAWQAPSGPAAVITFDQPGEAEMIAYDAQGQVIGAHSHSLDPRGQSGDSNEGR